MKRGFSKCPIWKHLVTIAFGQTQFRLKLCRQNQKQTIIVLILFFVLYKGYVAFTEFEIGVSDRVAKIEEQADFEKQDDVIALMMYLGDPPELIEHLLVSNKSKCLEMKLIAEETSFAYYECAKVDAIVKGNKIIKINRELEVL